MLNQDFVKPQYNSRCFADIPPTIKYLLTGAGQPALSPTVFGDLPQRYDAVIFFFVDAFGWRFFERYRDNYPFLQRLTNEGVVSKLTAQFPSTTAAHVTCIHTGLPVGQSGIYEWQYYEPHVDAVITPLLFSLAGTTERDTLKPTGIDPRRLYPTQTFYQDLQKHGVTSYVFQHRAYTPSTYSDIVFAGAKVRPYKTLPEALVNIQQLLAQPQKGPTYCFLYFDAIDAISHDYGPNSAQVAAEIDTFLRTMDRLLLQTSAEPSNNTLFMMTADHGQVEVDPKTTIYLNRESRLASVKRYFKTNQKGQPLVPAGAPRDMFLHIKAGMLEEAKAFLAEGLEGKAEVHQVSELIKQGWFGPTPVSDELLARVGNLVILPYRYESVWWYEAEKFEQKFYGHHGGLTPAEMEIPMLLYNLPKGR